MDRTKYVGMDVHKDTVTIAVMNSAGRVVMESILETKAARAYPVVSANPNMLGLASGWRIADFRLLRISL